MCLRKLASLNEATQPPVAVEPAGFAVGIISLAALFDSCSQLADYISLANNLGRDYEIAHSRFLLLKALLNAWKPCLNVLEYAEPVDKFTQERMLVGRSLVAIKSLLEDGQKLELRYGLREENTDTEPSLDDKRGLSEEMFELERKLDKSVCQRQQRASWGKKLRWAIRDKMEFGRLITELSSYIDELERLAARLNVPISSPIQRSIRSITVPATVRLLEEAVAAPREDQSGSSTPSHLYIRNQVAEHARVVFGNVDMLQDTGRSHVYNGNQIIGDARVIFGNASLDSISRFLGS